MGARALEAKNLGDYELAEQLYLQAQSEGDLESLALDPRLPSEREEIIIENITNVFTVLNDPLAQLYNSHLESLD